MIFTYKYVLVLWIIDIINHSFFFSILKLIIYIFWYNFFVNFFVLIFIIIKFFLKIFFRYFSKLFLSIISHYLIYSCYLAMFHNSHLKFLRIVKFLRNFANFLILESILFIHFYKNLMALRIQERTKNWNPLKYSVINL